MTAAHYKGGHHPGNDLGLHYTALPPIVASCPYSDQLLVTRKFWSPGANRPSQASDNAGALRFGGVLVGVVVEHWRQTLAHVPFQIISKHAQKHVGAHAVGQPVIDRPDLQV